MGNRAHVIFTDGESVSPAVYLHWNGGPESVYAFVAELTRRKVRADADYECARFVQLVGQCFDQDGPGGLSLGIHNVPAGVTVDETLSVRHLADFDHGDNGIYIVNRLAGTMRRIVMGREWSEMEVARERRAALTHEYATSLAATFLAVAHEQAVRVEG